MVKRINRLVICGLMAAVLAGCGAPSATLDLITLARKAMDSTRQGQLAQHSELMRQFKAQAAALDEAFDADVKLVAAGQIKDASGQPLSLSPQWVISARKGYVAARDIVSQQTRSAETAHATRIDNIKVADEALEMASQLIVRQWAISDRIKQELINVQRRLVHGR